MNDDTSGYRRPPKSTQFKTGRSGNRKGRQKGTTNLKTYLFMVMNQPVVVNQNGKRRAISGRKALAIKLRQEALQGDKKVLHDLTGHLLKHDHEGDAKPQIEEDSESDREIFEDLIRRYSRPGQEDDKS